MQKKMNYKYINILLLLGIIYLLYLMSGVWLNVVSRLFTIILPFLIGFVIAYALYPLLRFLISKKIPKALAVFLIIFSLILIAGLTAYYVVPLFFNQLVNLLSSLTKISTDIATKYGVDMETVNQTINTYSSKIISKIGEFFSNGTFIPILNKSIDYISKGIIIFIVSIYFLSDMPNIRYKIKRILKKRDIKKYHLISNIDREITSYLKGLGIFMIIQFFEYTFLFLIIGHPNFLLLGVLACVTTVIPYFGGIITNVIALLIASVVSRKLFILTLIITLVFPNIDGYIISPKIYGKTNQLPPLLTIFSVFAGGALFGFIGIVIAVPLTIIILSIIKSYKHEIGHKIRRVKENI